MQDIVVVAIARTVPEAIYLTETLEEAEIPVVSRNDNTQGLTASAYESRICVPRVLKSKALEAINSARTEAEQVGVEQAFDVESVADTTQDVATDKTMEEMFLLRERDAAERRAALEEHVAAWLGDGRNATEIAHYLAAAGLNITEAQELLEAVKHSQGEMIEAARSSQRFWGILIVAAGLLSILFFGMVVKLSGWLTHTVELCILGIGLAMVFSSAQPQATIKVRTDNDARPPA